MKTKIRIGITGGIGAGKSLICRIISTMGYPVFFSDNIAKSILNSDPIVIQKITSLFGKEAYLKGALNRPYIAQKVFNDQTLLNQLNSIVHPAVRSHFDVWTEKQSKNLVFNEAAILFETGSYKNFDLNVLVTASEQTRTARVMKRDGITEEEVKARMGKQWSDEKKRPLANFIITNNEDEMLIPQVIQLLKKLTT